MAYLLRALILLMVVGIALTVLTAFGMIDLGMGHISIAIPSFIYVIFAQAFVMFYFIGVARLTNNVDFILKSENKENLKELFEDPPEDLGPYLKKLNQFVHEANTAKRQTVPWGGLMVVLGMIAFLLGGAHDTNLVAMTTHSGVVYGFLVAMFIGFFRQWYYLGKAHRLLRKLKTLFSIPDAQM
ncbi:MAG: hypothetical protein ACPGJV_03505 [Bacteriovoracaceae bacterium]